MTGQNLTLVLFGVVLGLFCGVWLDAFFGPDALFALTFPLGGYVLWRVTFPKEKR